MTKPSGYLLIFIGIVASMLSIIGALIGIPFLAIGLMVVAKHNLNSR